MENIIQNLPIISKTAISSYFNKNANTLKNSISYWKKRGSLIQVKRGFFVYADFLKQNDNALYYPRFLATKMIEPSYISKETILQDYQMLADIVYGFSIITTKKTSTQKNQFGNFNYQSIKKELFKGYRKIKYGDMQWFVATKAKALFDYIYFNLDKFREISKEELNELRLNFNNMGKNDWKEFQKYLKNAPKKMNDIYEIMIRI